MRGILLVFAVGCTTASEPLRLDAGIADDPLDAGRMAGDSASRPDGCVPSCAERLCGGDGCGGSCGSCGPGANCDESGACVAPMSLCPPPGPVGMRDGETIPDVAFVDCEGAEVSLHDFCEAPATWVFEFAGWCPPCNAFAASGANALVDRFEAEGVQGLFVISEDTSSASPTLEYCRAVRDRYGLRMTVVIDSTGAFQRALEAPSNSYSVVLEEGAQIVWRAHYAEDLIGEQVRAVLDAR
jgi:peroxiredoxin